MLAIVFRPASARGSSKLPSDGPSRSGPRRRCGWHVIAQRPELIAWYELRGYRRTRAQKPFHTATPGFSLPRRPDLMFEVLTKVR